MAEEKKVVEMSEQETEAYDEDFIDSEIEEVTEKENLFSKAKRVVKANKKKILAAGALLVTGAIGFALGARSGSDDDDDIIDGEAEEVCDLGTSEESDGSTEE